jgi:hypothetical protein
LVASSTISISLPVISVPSLKPGIRSKEGVTGRDPVPPEDAFVVVNVDDVADVVVPGTVTGGAADLETVTASAYHIWLFPAPPPLPHNARKVALASAVATHVWEEVVTRLPSLENADPPKPARLDTTFLANATDDVTVTT